MLASNQWDGEAKDMVGKYATNVLALDVCLQDISSIKEAVYITARDI